MTTHVVPAEDRDRHDTTETCDCGPRTERVTRADGSTWWVVVHRGPVVLTG